MNEEKRLMGSNFKTRAVIDFMIRHVELRMAASIAKDYREFVELISTGAAESYEYRKGIFYDSSWPGRDMIYWNDPEINIDEINEYIKIIRFTKVS